MSNATVLAIRKSNSVQNHVLGILALCRHERMSQALRLRRRRRRLKTRKLHRSLLFLMTMRQIPMTMSMKRFDFFCNNGAVSHCVWSGSKRSMSSRGYGHWIRQIGLGTTPKNSTGSKTERSTMRSKAASLLVADFGRSFDVVCTFLSGSGRKKRMACIKKKFHPAPQRKICR
jgi:hypothetical protein